jgi:transcriptional regulator with XRE-family HTH domain
MSQFPETLKTWRNARRLSQLDLACAADVSARHISFLETGRARPSRDMVTRLGDALQLPLATRNQMLTDAGFAQRYPNRNWDTEEMAPVRAAIDHMLAAHAPYPAIAIDRRWYVFKMNGPAQSLFGMLDVVVGSSLIDLIMSDRLVTLIENWPEVARHTAQRLRTESAAQGGVPEFDRAIRKLTESVTNEEPSLKAVVPTIYRNGDIRLSLFATIAQFGTPEDLALDDFKIELFFPADAETENYLRGNKGETT